MQRFTIALCLYIAGGAVLVNLAGNMAANTAEGMQRAQEARTERLCQVNPVYCD